jgi:hypothetical protein
MPVRAAVVLALAFTSSVSAEAPAARTAAMPRAVRDRLDRLALRLPGDGVDRAVYQSVEGLPFGLLAAGGMTAEEEGRRATDRWLLDGTPAAETPAAAQRVFDRLIAELPPHLSPHGFHWFLTVLDAPGRDAFTIGGGFVYVTRPRLDELLADSDRGEAALAFVLADEIGRTALGHTRRAWELQASLESLAGHAPFGIPARAAAAALGANDAAGHFAYTALEYEDADRFALHLCRNAGFDLDAVLDSVRAQAKEDLDDKGDLLPDRRGLGLARLRRLLMERDGIYDDETVHGLFVYDRKSERLARCGPRQVSADERPVILIHGMRGNQYALDSYLTALGKQPELAGRPILVFRYPNNDSLSRSGRFLGREMRRCVGDPAKAVFVCHSAGGLVFRWYAEVDKGGFDRAVLLAVPNAGSTMAEFKAVVDLVRFGLDLPEGLDFALEDGFAEGDGQIALDLHPDSLFLRRLGREKPPLARYQVFYGTVFDFWQSLELLAGYAVAKRYAAEALSDLLPFPAVQARLLNLVEQTPLPEEVTRGDLAVSARSAALPGVAKTTGLRMFHEAFRYDPDIIRRVTDAILER